MLTDYNVLKDLREAELKHGRIAMLAVLGAIVQENWHPLLSLKAEELNHVLTHFKYVMDDQPWALGLPGLAIAAIEGFALAQSSVDKALKQENKRITGRYLSSSSDLRCCIIYDACLTGSCFHHLVMDLTGDWGFDPFGIIKADNVEGFTVSDRMRRIGHLSPQLSPLISKCFSS